jgi:hypothetical protein
MTSTASRLERAVERLTVDWLRGVRDWTPFAAGDGRRSVCAICLRYAERFQLDETPHELLHALAAPVDALIRSAFTAAATERYGDLEEEGWWFGVEDGLVRVCTPAGSPVVDVLPSFGDRVPGADEVAETRGAGVRLELILIHAELVGSAVGGVLSRHPVLVRAVRDSVEPRLRSLSEQLLAEICEV